MVQSLLILSSFVTFQMDLNPWDGYVGYAEYERALELNGRQVLFECGHGRYWYLGDQVLSQVEHKYPPTIVPNPLCHTVQLADFLVGEEIARAHNSYIIARVEGNYSKFIRFHLQGCLVGRTIFLFPSEVKFLLCPLFFIFLLGNKICMLDLQPPSSEGKEGGEEEEEIPSPHHAGSSSSSFMETYPHFPT